VHRPHTFRKLPKKERVRVEKKGSFFETDREGYVINSTSPEKIQDKWKSALDDIACWYQEEFGDSLENIYVRGSVAKGEAIEEVSDVDTFAYVNLSSEEIDEKSKDIKEARTKINEKYLFIEGVEIIIEPIERSRNKSDITLLNQSLCIFGEPINYPHLKPGKDMALHASNIDERIKSINEFVKGVHSDDRIKNKCVWAMKGLLRSGCEIVMERSGKYTRDLYPCYEVFSEYYPKKEPEMREVLKLTLNPISDKRKIKEKMDTLGSWLQKEAEKYL
jgi:hypothetical protein